MKKLNAEGFESLIGKDKWHRELNPQIAEINALGIGEGLLIFKNEWSLKNPPAQAIRHHALKDGKQFKSKMLADGSGWGLLRIE